MSKRKSSSSSKSTSTATTSPNVPGYIQGPAQDFFSQIGGMLNQTAPTFGATGNQQAAFQGGAQLSGVNSGVTQGMDATRNLLNYTPGTIQGRTISAPQAYNPMQVASQNVSAGQLRDTDLGAYMNPFINDVVSTSLADLERSRQGAISEGQGRAVSAGAYGGSRHGVADSLTNEAALRAAASTSAGLRSQGFQNAQNMALADINARYGADTFNAGNALQAALANQGAGLTAGLAANADQMNAARYNADSLTGADQFNVNAGMQGANFRLGAANQLYGQGVGADANTRANLGTQAALGEQERAINQQNNPQQAQINYLAQLAQILGIDPSDFIGQTINQTGKSSGTQKSGGGFGFSWGPFSFGG